MQDVFKTWLGITGARVNDCMEIIINFEGFHQSQCLFPPKIQEIFDVIVIEKVYYP